MLLNETHIALLTRAAGDLVIMPRMGGRATAMNELISRCLVEPTKRRVGNKVLDGYRITAAGRGLLKAYKAGMVEESGCR